MYKVLNAPYEPVLCEYVLDELHRKFQEKFPDRQVEMEAFLFTLQNNVEIVDTPDEVVEEENSRCERQTDSQSGIEFRH